MRQAVKQDDPAKRKTTAKWLRVLLMGLLVLAAAIAFYINNLRIIEFLQR